MPDLSPTSLPHQLPLWGQVDRWISRWEVRSETEKGRGYVVAIDRDGAWGCSCPGWIYNPKRTHCKHIRAVRLGRSGGEPS